MQITEEDRDKILFAIPKLSRKDADKIARNTKYSTMTVYRHYTALRKGSLNASPIIRAIMKVALFRMPRVVKENHELVELQRQLSAV